MSWIAVARKEYLENVRNAWVVAVSVIFLALTILVSLFVSIGRSASTGQATFGDIVPTLTTIDTFTGFLVPILALMLGFGTIAGERESGSLALLMAQPVRRSHIVLGKWLGLFGVLATAILLGFGLGGLFVLIRTAAPGGDYGTFALFLLETLAWGAAWISVTVFLSSWFNRRGTAIAASIGAWFFFSTIIWTLLTAIVVVLLFRSSLAAGAHAPSWFVVTQWLNPNTAYEGLLSASGLVGAVSNSTRALLGDVFQPLAFGIALAAWVVVPFWGAYALFERKDA